MATANPIPLLQAAIGHHQAGRLAEAERGYRQVLGLAPEQPDALHLLGVIAYQVGQHPAAIELIRKAIGQRRNVATRAKPPQSRERT